MAQDIVGGLFGIQQQPDYATQDYRNAMAMAELNSPKAMGRFVGGMIGSQIGRGLGQAAQGLLGVEDPRLKRQKLIAMAQEQKLDPSTPEGARKIAEFFRQNDDLEMSARATLFANQLEESQSVTQLKAAQAEAALREKKGSPESQAEQVILNQLQQQFGEIEGANRFYQMKLEGKVKTAAAGAAQYGQEKIANLSGAQNIVEGYTKKPMERLQAIGEAQTYLGQSGVNPAAVPQLRRALVKLGGGDSQVAQREVQQIAGSMGIAGNVAEAVNQFFTGKPSSDQLKLIGQVVKAAETYYAGQYSKGRQQAETVLGAAKLDPMTRNALLPPAYNLPEQKKATSTGGWKIIGVK